MTATCGPAEATALDHCASDDGTPLLDDRAVSLMVEAFAPAEFQELLAMGLTAFVEYCGHMGEPLATPARIRGEAHKIKGSAGSLGFKRIAVLAARIETCGEHELASELLLVLPALALAIAETRRLLVSHGHLREVPQGHGQAPEPA